MQLAVGLRNHEMDAKMVVMTAIRIMVLTMLMMTTAVAFINATNVEVYNATNVAIINNATNVAADYEYLGL